MVRVSRLVTLVGLACSVFVAACTTSPCDVIRAPLTISSSRSSASAPSFTRRPRSAPTFREYSWLACTETVLGQLTSPWIVTPRVFAALEILSGI